MTDFYYQVIDDADGFHDTVIVADVDLAASDEAGAPVWRTVGLRSAGLAEAGPDPGAR